MKHRIDELIKQHGVALTGGIATGKSTVAKILSELGLPVIDADKIARDVTAPDSPALKAIVEHFGAACVNSDGTLNRRVLRNIIFSDERRRLELEKITHPLIREGFLKKVTDLDLVGAPRDFIYDAALIYEMGMADLFREVWVTYCEPGQQIKRLMERDGVSRDQAERTIASQLDAKNKADLADVIVFTDCTHEQLKERVSAKVKDRNLKIH
jgi:dephospho-CoA kinase